MTDRTRENHVDVERDDTGVVRRDHEEQDRYEQHVQHDDHVHDHDHDHGADELAAGAAIAGPLSGGVRWGAIWGGLITALGMFLILTTAALAIGLQAVTGAPDSDAGTTSAIVSGVIALVAFFVGGLVAGWGAGLVGAGYGALNGFLVWGLGVAVILLLTAFGLGSIFGAAGELFAQFQRLEQFQLQNVDAGEVIDSIRTGAIGAFLAMLLPAVAATLGGLLGALRVSGRFTA